MKNAIPFVLVGLALTGCGGPQPVPGPERSVEYYDANHEERGSVLKICDANPGLYASDRNCFNADASRHKVGQINGTGGKGYTASGD